MTLDKEDIATAKEMAQTLQKSRNSELIVVGNLLSHLLAERVAPQRTWVGLTDEQIAKEVEAELTHYWNGEYIDTTGARDQLKAFARAIEAKLREKNSL
jgi:hypothetical protein